MGVSRMARVEILAHSSVKMPVLAALQDAGTVQVEETNRAEFRLAPSPGESFSLDRLLDRLEQGLDFLSLFDDRGLRDKLTAQKPALSRSERERLAGFPYLPVLEEIEKQTAERQELQARLAALQKEIEFLLPLSRLSVPVAEFRRADGPELVLGVLPRAQERPFLGLAAEEAVWHEFILEEKRRLIVFLFYARKDAAIVEEKLKELQFVRLNLAGPGLDGAAAGQTVADIIVKDRREMDEINARMSGLDKEAEKLKVHREKLGQVRDLFHNEHEKAASSQLLGETEKVVVLEGWVKSVDAAGLRSALEPYAGSSEIYLRPPLPGEEPPVILENPRSFRPFQVVTELFGLPGADSRDPTVPLAPFFFVFVGLCVSEAGYGAVVTLLSLLYLKFARPKGGAGQFARLMLLLGISNILFGTLVGGWFGFPIRKLLVLDPLKDPIKFLALSLVLGFIQVWYGTLLGLIDCWKKREIQPVLVKAGWLILLPALVGYLLTKHPASGVLALLGAALIILFHAPSKNPLARIFGGLYGLYGISGYLGDTLSYSRILALGLSTGVIAMVINTLAKTALGVPWVGWIFAALIFVGGHTFNMAIGFLGGFVHSMRLQFVEFFTKFFQGGGKPFRPFRMEGKYVDFV